MATRKLELQESNEALKRILAELKERNKELENECVQLRRELDHERSCKSEMRKSFEISEAALNEESASLEKRVKELESDAKNVGDQRTDAFKTLAEACKICSNTVSKFKKQRRDAMIEERKQMSAQSTVLKRSAEIPATEKPTNENNEASPPADVSRPRRSTRINVDYANRNTVGAMMDDEELGDANVSKRGKGKRGTRGSARGADGRGVAKRTAAASGVSEHEHAEDKDDAEYGQKSKGKANGGRGAKRGRPRGSRTSAAPTRTRKSPAKKTKNNDESEKEEGSKPQTVAAEESM